MATVANDQRRAAAHRTGGTVEDGQEAVAGDLDLATAEARQHRSHGLVVEPAGPRPRRVAEASGERRRVHDVGEEEGC
jgi:hypothetical protein